MSQQHPHNPAQILYFSHGGGPLPLLGDASHQAMVNFMVQLPTRLVRPDAIIVISAHWEEFAATLLGAATPAMVYDYYGFPAQAYEINYPAPGNPALAEKIAGLLGTANIPVTIDRERGFDHGLYIPLKLMYPSADIPCLQLSLLKGLDPAAHIALGKTLQGLLQENLLVIGSGFSFHNMRAFSWRDDNLPDPANDAFQQWLIDVCTDTSLLSGRDELLSGWEKAPSARYCHPREEHLLPLHVCCGMAQGPAQLLFDDYILGKRAVAFLW